MKTEIKKGETWRRAYSAGFDEGKNEILKTLEAEIDRDIACGSFNEDCERYNVSKEVKSIIEKLKSK